MSNLDQLVKGRKAAEEVLDLIESMHPDDETDRDFQRGFWRAMLSEAMKNADSRDIPKPAQRSTMTESEAKHYEKLRIEFGIHEGKQYAEVPISYLAWLSVSSEQLAAYLRSDRGQERQGKA